MDIGILEPGQTPADLRTQHGTFAEMAARLLRPLAPDFSFTAFQVNEDSFPECPESAAGWLVMGSAHGVYDDLPWMRRLKEFLRAALAAGRPVVGICFGHQILAEAMGGRVAKADAGWGCGVNEYKSLPGDAPGPGLPASLRAQAMHQDQVVAPPPGAEVILASAHCPYAGLSYAAGALSFQFHPEFDADFVAALIRARRGRVIPEPLAERALAGIGEPTDHPLVGQRIVEFFRARARAA